MDDIFTVRDIWGKRRRNLSFSEIAATHYYERKITRIATQVYQWKEIENLDIKLIEHYCWLTGFAIIWKDDYLGLVITGGSETAWDHNGRATRWRPVFDMVPPERDSALPELNKDQCVVIYDLTNPRIRRSDCLWLITEIVDIRETIRQQIFNQKTPLLAITGNQNIKSKLKQMIVDIAENMKALFIDADMADSVKPLDFNAPFNAEALESEKSIQINEMLEYLGIDNESPFKKKERMITDEVEGNDEVLNYLLLDGLRSREDGAKKLKTMFGIDTNVQISEIVRPHDDLVEDGENDKEAERV